MAMKTLKVTRDEWAFFGTVLPYIKMAVASLLLLAMGLITRVGVKLQHNIEGTPPQDSSSVLTAITITSLLILLAVAGYLFQSRRGRFMVGHILLTVFLAHAWMIIAIWDNLGAWTFGSFGFYSYFYGSIIVGLSWCIRRWAMDNQYDPEMVEDSAEIADNPFKAAGLGDAYLDRGEEAEGGTKFRLHLPVGKLVEDAKARAAHIAHIAGVPRNRVHITEPEDGIEGQADILILSEKPFGQKVIWQGPQNPGESIALPITYATYDTGLRPKLYIAGKNGASSQHFLTMGMPGTGKSKAWQVIYGSVLARKEVSVIFGDPAKGMQTGGPLASKLEWFATTEKECLEQIQAIMRAIPARTDYLTARGYDHWQSGCGLNFVIFHLEEAARFSEVDELVELVEAARSAGICIVVSLQRATSTRLNTSARYNLGANMCFGVKMKRDASFGLSEYAIEAGAVPHVWQDRKPGQHYLEAQGIDTSLAGHPLQTDWIDIKRLEQEVDGYSYNNLDSTTSDALGKPYNDYRKKVSDGTTNWQQMRKNRGFEIDTKDWEVGHPDKLSQDQTEILDSEEYVSTDSARFGFHTPSDETQAYREQLISIIDRFREDHIDSFTPADIRKAGFQGRSPAWISQNLKKLALEGVLEYSKEDRFYRIV